MILLGTIVNTLAILVGGGIGLLLKKGLNEKLSDTMMKGLGLCVLYIGISGSLQGNSTLNLLLSMVIGCLIGESIDLEQRIIDLGNWLQRKSKMKNKESNITIGFVNASLLFCVGGMAIVGSLQSGLTLNHETIYMKAVIDGVAAILLASQLGIGVLFSGFLLFAYQGSITLLASTLQPILNDVVIAQMSCVGSICLICVALNMLKVGKFKTMNYVPAIFVSVILSLFI